MQKHLWLKGFNLLSFHFHQESFTLFCFVCFLAIMERDIFRVGECGREMGFGFQLLSVVGLKKSCSSTLYLIMSFYVILVYWTSLYICYWCNLSRLARYKRNPARLCLGSLAMLMGLWIYMKYTLTFFGLAEEKLLTWQDSSGSSYKFGIFRGELQQSVQEKLSYY